MPNAKFTMPANVAARGRTTFGNWSCLMSWFCMTTEVIASLTLAVNHFHGRIAAKMNSG